MPLDQKEEITMDQTRIYQHAIMTHDVAFRDLLFIMIIFKWKNDINICSAHGKMYMFCFFRNGFDMIYSVQYIKSEIVFRKISCS